MSLLLSLALSAGSLLASEGSTTAPSEVDFDRDVRPILSENCFACHGPDAGSRKANLRLDTRAGATADLGGYAAVTPGKPEESELWLRVISTEEGEVMPPPDSHKPPLDDEQRRILRAWIEAGAPWAEHWAFVPPAKSEIETSQHPVDFFVDRGLRRVGLERSPRAATHTLARRLAFDLTGLPPSLGRIAALEADDEPVAWDAYVEELLASPHYGERLAMWWLDGARYADTDGFQQDAVRDNWPWRDWVARAFQEGMPFDRFTQWQFAGDLLPNATSEQILATCFHRNHMHNGEGGRDPEESRVDYVRDRVNTVGSVWLGLTLSCAQCHDHKFDPVSQAEYYSLTAFFDSIAEDGRAGGAAGPFHEVRAPQAEPALRRARQELSQTEAQIDRFRDEMAPAFKNWLQEQRTEATSFQAWRELVPTDLSSAEGSELHLDSGGYVRCSSGTAIQEDYLLNLGRPDLKRLTGIELTVERDEQGRLSFSEDDEFILTNVKLRVRKAGQARLRDIELASAVTDVQGKGADPQYGPVRGLLDDDPRTGWTTRTLEVQSARVVFALQEPLRLQPDEELVCILMHRSTTPRAHLARFRLRGTNQPGQAVRNLGPMPLERWARHVTQPGPPLSVELWRELRDQYLEDDPAWHVLRARRAELRHQTNQAQRSAGKLRVTVLKERPEPRSTHLLERGLWDQKGPSVVRAVPAALGTGEIQAASSRLALANWITSRDNPLTARVVVNQVWQLLFGAGLVRTPGDFGLQGARPTHPELLDWLAVDFMDHGWDLRHLLRTIVSSETYQQSSRVSEELLERDPDNRLLARGARFRLPSWMIRDSILAASGMLDRGIGGPPIFPYQPAGVWADSTMGRFTYRPTLGKARHRRSLYAFWRRNTPPTYLFDNATRRQCEVEVRRTNTPLQSLTLLNDRAFFEAAQTLARQVRESYAQGLEAQVQALANRILQRRLEESELRELTELYDELKAHYEADREAAVAASSPSELALPDAWPPAEVDVREAVPLAAMTGVANLMLNLDEALTHE